MNIVSLVVASVTIVAIAFLLVRKISEYDIWYHMAVGQEILRTASFPTTDRLSLLNYGQPYHARLWFFRILAVAGYKVAGFWWLHAMQTALWGMTFWIVYRCTRIWTSSNASWLLLLIMAIACEERFTIRPELVSYLMLAVYYWRLQQGKYRSLSDLAVFFLLQEIWTNSHGLFSIGPFMAACYLAAALIQNKDEYRRKEVRSLFLLVIATVAGCLITPIGLDSIKYTQQLITTVFPSALATNNTTNYVVYELAHPLGEIGRSLISFWFYFTLLAAFLVTGLASALSNWRQVPLARTLIVSAMLATSMTGIRNVPLFTVVAAPLVAEYFSLLRPGLIRQTCSATVATSIFIAMIVWSPKEAISHLKNWVPYRFGVGLAADYVPLGLPAFLDRIAFSGPIFNSQNMGGFYEFHGSPARIPFYDYRLEDYDPETLKEIYNIVFTAYAKPTAWNELVRKYGFQGILLENGSPEADGLLPLLSAQTSGWRLVYLDYAASFWLRTDQTATPPAISLQDVAALAGSSQNFAQSQNLDTFLNKTSLYPDLRLSLLERANRQWERPPSLRNLGLHQMQLGMLDDADRTFRRLLELYPGSGLTLATLAQIALLRGDVNAAEGYLRKALKYSPDDPDLKENLAIVLKSGKR